MTNQPRDERVFRSTEQPTLHHVSLFVSDMPESIAFYTEGLGLVLRESFDDIIGLRSVGEDQFPFCVASIFLEGGDGRYIELHPAGEGLMSPPGFPMNHLALSVADVDSVYQQALGAGASPFGFDLSDNKWDGSPMDVIMSGMNPEPMRMAFLQGPSGELIELYQASTQQASNTKNNEENEYA